MAQSGGNSFGIQNLHFALSCSVPSPPLSGSSSALLVQTSPIVTRVFTAPMLSFASGMEKVVIETDPIHSWRIT